MKTAITILDAQGSQVFGLDSTTAAMLYARGDRVFQLPHGMTVRLSGELPIAEDLRNPSLDRALASLSDAGTTTHRTDRFFGDL